MGEALKLIEDMISVDLFQARTKARFRGHPKILCCYTQEVFFSGRYYLFEFFCRLLNVPVVPVSTSTEFISYRFIRKTRAAAIFAPSNPDLTSKDNSTASLA
jgi:hypothetical protein